MSDSIDKTIPNNVNILFENKVEEYKYIPPKTTTLPNISDVREIMEMIKSIIFPGFFHETGCTVDTQKYHIGVAMEQLYVLLKKQIQNSVNFFNEQAEGVSDSSADLANIFINKIPEIKRLLCTDVKATFDGDPAAKSYGEVIFCYPTIQAMLHYRTAHELLLLGIPVLPRIITEMAHSATGIDIHPGAKVGEYFCIDHGTGVVIGETCIIGNHVRLYQGVTLGAKSFTLDERGLPMNVPRHPIIEDNVIIYSNSSILGRITIGHDSVIGGNVWQTSDVPPFSRILQRKATNE